jgi:NAD(P)-dependent dehydrogenase (short-subunit alcohol dehydrogenase family)
MRLQGRTAVVTGAAAGLGRAISLRFAVEGAHVIAVDIHPPETTATEIIEKGGAVTALTADVTSVPETARILEAARAPTGRVDILVNNAGKFGGTSLLEVDDAQWDYYLDLNLSSVFRMCRTFVAAMLEQDEIEGVRGRIINMGSQLGLTAPPGALAYAATKAGVIHMTRQIAVDYGPRGIVINSIAPGRIITGDHPGERDYLDRGTIDAATAFSLTRTPFSRLGRPDDVAGAALYLASSDSTFVSGAVISVDGGWTAY